MRSHSTSIFTFLALLLFPVLSTAQNTGFVHASGTSILDNQGQNIIFRGIGTGNWMLQEGYMMGTSGATNGTQWHFRQKLISTIGLEKTNQFFNAWWDDHLRKVDVDSMAAWGFNSIRVAMHYKMFTLPIEEEPEAGKDTWLESGFQRIDNLLQWCAENHMYLILDMHGCPGAQGSDSNISDYDSSKPSLWESEENKRKLVALWKKLAQRYSQSPWIGGYDLINEPKWDALQANSNRDLWDMFKRIVDAVREVDNNHLIFLAGNNWGNNYTGLPTISNWGGNIALSFHKYWSYNSATAIDWIINLGKQHNVPIWLGESGENSNTWFADLIRLCESKNVGWSWWPVKKMGINNILRSKSNSEYTQLMNAWKNNSSINTTTAFNGLMKFAEDHKFENCAIQYDVIDAMITRPHTNETRPYKNNQIGSEIFAVNYDFGPVGYAYFDKGDADYHSSGETYTNWNQGWTYRNDGVDIQSCSDQINNGYSVGWIEDGEWLNYTISSAEPKAYSIFFRYASQTGGGRVYVEINGKRVSRSIDLPATGSWTTWNTAIIPNLIFPQGVIKLRLVFEKGNFNFNYFKITSARDIENVNFDLLSAETDRIKNEIILDFNQQVDQISTTDLNVKVNGTVASVLSVKKNNDNPQQIVLSIDQSILSNSAITIDNSSETCLSGSKKLTKFSGFEVTNKAAQHFSVPAKVKAENFAANNGFVFQTCEDIDGGQNAGYTNSGDYLDFIIYAESAGEYNTDLRVAVNAATARLAFYDIADKSTLLKTVTLPYTSGWQQWRTVSTTANLKQGKNIFRVMAISDGFNLNWIEFKTKEGTGISSKSADKWDIYPNPVKSKLTISLDESSIEAIVTLYDATGKKLSSTILNDKINQLDMSNYQEGMYILKINRGNEMTTKKIQILK